MARHIRSKTSEPRNRLTMAVLDNPTYERVKAAAAARNWSISSLMYRAVLDYLKAQDEKAKQAPATH